MFASNMHQNAWFQDWFFKKFLGRGSPSPLPRPLPRFSRASPSVQASPSILGRFAPSTRASPSILERFAPSIRASPSTFDWGSWFGPPPKVNSWIRQWLDPSLDSLPVVMLYIDIRWFERGIQVHRIIRVTKFGIWRINKWMIPLYWLMDWWCHIIIIMAYMVWSWHDMKIVSRMLWWLGRLDKCHCFTSEKRVHELTATRRIPASKLYFASVVFVNSFSPLTYNSSYLSTTFRLLTLFYPITKLYVSWPSYVCWPRSVSADLVLCSVIVRYTDLLTVDFFPLTTLTMQISAPSGSPQITWRALLIIIGWRKDQR